jgi:hypothetical protein
MVKPIDIGLIQARRKKIEAEAKAEKERHEKALAALEAEWKELDIAERVFSRLSLEGGKNQRLVANGLLIGGETNVDGGGGKPEGLPPVSEMIKEALAYAVSLNAKGLKPAGLLSYIRGKWWPEAQSRDVGPVAWRMWQNEQLERFDSGEYTLLKAERVAIRQNIESGAATMPPPGPIPQGGG